jgi:hypothetical protein
MTWTSRYIKVCQGLYYCVVRTPPAGQGIPLHYNDHISQYIQKLKHSHFFINNILTTSLHKLPSSYRTRDELWLPTWDLNHRTCSPRNWACNSDYGNQRFFYWRNFARRRIFFTSGLFLAKFGPQKNILVAKNSSILTIFHPFEPIFYPLSGLSSNIRMNWLQDMF